MPHAIPLGRLVTALLSVFVVSSTTVAQPIAAFAPAAIAPSGASTVYALQDAAAYTEGCYPPCLCPVWINNDLRGTFVLREVFNGGTLQRFAVDDVNWWIGSGADEVRVTGSGRYTRISGIAGWTSRLTLSLTVGGETGVYDSGFVNETDPFPSIDLSVALNDFFCYDMVFRVNARPARVLCQSLTNDAAYTEGCLPPCLCPIFSSADLHGRYGLVELQNFGTYIEYAVVNADFRVRSPFTPPSERFDGFGRYTRISGFAGWIHQMELDLSVDGGPLTRFDSGAVNGGGDYPAVDITLAQNGFFCYDTILDVVSRPCPSLQPMLTDDR